MYQLLGGIALAVALAGGGFFTGKQVAEGAAAKERGAALEQQAVRLQKEIDAANDRAEKAERVRDEVQARAAAARAQAQTSFANLRRRADDANLTTITENGRRVDLDQYPFSDEFVRLFDGASRTAGGEPTSPESAGGTVGRSAAGADAAAKPAAK